MTARVRTLYQPFYRINLFAGFCSKCQDPIAGQSYTLGIDVWQDGVLTRSPVIKGHENLCEDCFKPVRGRFQEKTEI